MGMNNLENGKHERAIMNPESSVKIIGDFCDLNAKAGGTCSDWCIGATDDVSQLRERLGIPHDYDWCLCHCATSAAEAKAIVLGFHNVGFQLSADAAGPPNDSAVYVYTYRKQPVPQPQAAECRA
jgi:hypothetical protein